MVALGGVAIAAGGVAVGVGLRGAFRALAVRRGRRDA